MAVIALLVGLSGCGVDAVELPPVTGEPPPDVRPLPELGDDALPEPPPAGLQQLIAYGQSLAMGQGGRPALTVTPAAPGAYEFSGGIVLPEKRSRPTWLVERETETGWAEAGRYLAARDSTHEWLVSSAAVGGSPYTALARGTTAYQALLDQATSGHAFAAARGESHSIPAVLIVHGESDAWSLHYRDSLMEWQDDLERDLSAISGQTAAVVTFHSQPSVPGGSEYAAGQSMLDASEDRPDRIFLVGPKYMLPHLDDGHLMNVGYRWMGAYYARAVEEVLMRGRRWEPTKPVAVTRQGAVITVRFHVPTAPLVFDTERVTDPGMHGFEYWEDAGPSAVISVVELVASDTVRITLSRQPSGRGARLRYAWSAPSAGFPRGTLRDSEPATSSAGDPLFNWCVSFSRPLP